MNKTVVVVLIIIAVAILITTFALRPSIQQHSEALSRVQYYTGQLERYVALAEKLQNVLALNTEEFGKLKKEFKKEQEQNAVLRRVIQQQLREISDMMEQLEQFEEEILPDISDVHPEDYEECLYELNRSRLTADTLLNIIYTQREEITLLRAVNTSQGLVIEQQATIIVNQTSYIENFEALLKEYNRRANRRIAVALGVGFIVALIL